MSSDQDLYDDYDVFGYIPFYRKKIKFSLAPMKQLLEDYKRRLVNIESLIRDNPNEDRLEIKAGCYRTFIAELERELKMIEENFRNLS